MSAAPCRRSRVVRSALLLLLFAFCAARVFAQNIVDGRRVEFQPSADNDTLVGGVPLVQGYTLSFYVAGSIPIVSSADLGKPTPDADGYMRVAYLSLLTTPLQPGTTYEARVVANGLGGSTSSAVSNTVILTASCDTSTISVPSVSVGPGAATGAVGVTSTCGWSSIINDPWITVTSGASGAGNGTLGYSVAVNALTSPRSGTITIAGNTFTVNQAAACTYAILPTSQALSVEGGTGSVAVTAGAACGWTAVSNNTPWLTVTSGSAGTGSGSVGFSASANNLASLRSGSLTIAGATFTVSEAACTITLTPTSQSVSTGGGTGSVTVTTGSACPWSSTSNAGWVSVTSGASGTGSGSVGFSADGNVGGTSRSGTITIGGQTFTVNEAGCSYVVAPTAISVNYNTLSSSITVTTSPTCAWVATETAPWATLGTGGTGTGSIAYSLTANTTATTRTTTFTIAGQGIDVTQTGLAPPGPPANVKIIR